MSYYRRDFTAGGVYFFTVNLADRKSSLLVERIDLLRATWRDTQSRYPFETLAVCVLPNHLHAVWQLPPNDADFSLRWRLIKSGFSRALPAATDISPSKIKHREKGIWQRRFWEHRIRNDADLENHINYVHFNPVKHGFTDSPENWPYSSYRRRVGKIYFAHANEEN